jgi:hypothetical protein
VAGGAAVCAARSLTACRRSVFGVLYTLSKEKESESLRWAALDIVLDFVQLLANVVNFNLIFELRIKFVDEIQPYVKWASLHSAVALQGYTFFQAIFWLLCVVLLISVTICGFVAHGFRTNYFKFVWPVKVLRRIISVFFKSFYVTSANIFFIVLSCTYAQTPMRASSSSRSPASPESDSVRVPQAWRRSRKSYAGSSPTRLAPRWPSSCSSRSASSQRARHWGQWRRTSGPRTPTAAPTRSPSCACS